MAMLFSRWCSEYRKLLLPDASAYEEIWCAIERVQCQLNHLSDACDLWCCYLILQPVGNGVEPL
jgi:hypothetical protein